MEEQLCRARLDKAPHSYGLNYVIKQTRLPPQLEPEKGPTRSDTSCMYVLRRYGHTRLQNMWPSEIGLAVNPDTRPWTLDTEDRDSTCTLTFPSDEGSISPVLAHLPNPLSPTKS